MAQQSLYRRYRPRRFSEIKGQEHVVRALRNAVASHREGQAYLFSGPRGTGKTTSARILAKVLNCERPVDGEPCCECESCKSVEAGTSFDVIELDAASNNKVDDIRDLIERVNLNTPGRHKVYILDEVHMLTPGAEAALLKTLEEPPPHVVFVLATTDPQKVRDTIRSRTQHLQFHLLNTEELEAHVRWVASDAGIELTDDAVEAVVRQGAGSARDTLSALEVVAASGGVAPEAVPLDEFVEAIVAHDPGRALAAVAASVHLGRDARGIADALLAHLRECFLSIMAPELVQLPDQRAEVVAEQAQRLGAAAAVRSMEGLGEILVEMRHAPDPRVLLEVALVKLTSETAGGDLGALISRVERLERAVQSGASGTGATPRPAPTDPTTGRAVLGGRARQAAAPGAPAASGTAAPRAEERPVVPAEKATTPAVPPAARTATPSGDLVAVFDTDVRPNLRGIAKAVYVVAQTRGVRDGALVLAFPNEGHAKRARDHQADVERALSTAAGAAARIIVESDASSSAAPSASAPDPKDHEVAASEIDDSTEVRSVSPVDLALDMFPGSELVEGDH